MSSWNVSRRVSALTSYSPYDGGPIVVCNPLTDHTVQGAVEEECIVAVGLRRKLRKGEVAEESCRKWLDWADMPMAMSHIQATRRTD